MCRDRISAITFVPIGTNIAFIYRNGGKYYHIYIYSQRNKEYKIFVPQRRDIMKLFLINYPKE
jgi:hypothetical protein